MALIWMNLPLNQSKQESGIFELSKPLVAVEKQINFNEILMGKGPEIMPQNTVAKKKKKKKNGLECSSSTSRKDRINLNSFSYMFEEP